MKKINRFLFTTFIASAALFNMSCSNDDNKPEPTIDYNNGNNVKIIVVNQGQFSKGNASLSTISPDGKVNNDIFQATNSRPLGDVAQSMAYMDGKYFIALNNSNKVEVIDAQSFKSLATILFTQEVSPRYIASLNDTEAVVSGGGLLAKINTKTFEVIEYIPVDNGSIEQMLRVDQKLFCTVPYGENSGLYVYNTNDLKTPRKIATTVSLYETSTLVQDKNGNIWTLGKDESDLFVCIDTKTESITDTIAVPRNISLTYYPRLAIGEGGSTLFFNGKQEGSDPEYVFAAHIADKSVKAYVELTNLGMTYGINVSSDGNVFVCDCLDYSAQRGYLREYRTDGSFISYRIGIYPGQVYFTENNK